MTCVRVRSGDFHARACEQGTLRVLVIDEAVELVSAPAEADLKSRLRRMPPPVKIIQSGNWTTQIYPGLLIDAYENNARRVWWFLPRRGTDWLFKR